MIWAFPEPVALLMSLLKKACPSTGSTQVTDACPEAKASSAQCVGCEMCRISVRVETHSL